MNAKTISLLYFSFFLFSLNLSYSQVGIGTTSPTAGSILDVTSTDKGLLVPRVDISNLFTIAPITGGAPAGLLVWNTNAFTGVGFHFWNGSSWNAVGSGGEISVDNGLNYNVGASSARLGGALVENTTITQGANQMTYNLDGTGDFNIQDNGVNRFQVLADGRVEMSGITDASGVANTGVLEIANSLRLDGNEIITNTGTVLYINNDNDGDVRIDGGTISVDASTNRVGVGTTTPTYELDVEGNIGHNHYMYHNGDADTFWRFPTDDQIRIHAGGVRMLDFVEDTNDYVVFNESGVDVDFRVETQNQVNGFFVNGGNDRIGIRTNNPSSFFEMTNGGVNVGANAMATYTNAGTSGVALSSYNTSATNNYNSLEGITAYNGGASVTGVFGLAINGTATNRAIGVRGIANARDGIGVLGTRNATGGAGFGGLFLNDLGYTGGFYNVSDRKTKKNVKKINKALDIVDKLNPVSYKFNLDKYPNMGLNTEKEYGFIAQEVRNILPEITRKKSLSITGAKAVKSNQEAVEGKTETFVMIDYTRFIPILTQAIKEQQEIIKAQKKSIKEQNKRLKALETKMDKVLRKN